MLGVSTAFQSRSAAAPSANRSTDERIAELLELPVTALAVAPPWRPGELELLLDACRRQKVTVVALEDFCGEVPDRSGGPWPDEVLSLADLDSTLRDRAVAGTLATLERAARLDGTCVIVDGGPLPLDRDGRGLLERLETMAVPAFSAARDGAELTRLRELFEKRSAPPHAAAGEALLQALDRVLTAADRLELPVALRVPGPLAGLPTPDDWRRLLAEFAGSPLRWWHDTGIAARRTAVLGEPLEIPTAGASAELLAGCDLHDHQPPHLGLPPGRGTIPFAEVLTGLPPALPLIVRLAAGTPVEELLASLDHLRALGLEGPPPRPWEDHLPRIG